MSFHRDGVEHVQALPLPDGVAADGGKAVISTLALVTWHSSHTGMLHQVYVNGRLAGTTIDACQRQLVVWAPSSFESAVCVEVIAVETKDAHTDFAQELDPPLAGARVRLSILRSQTLPLGASAGVYYDDGTGQIDYSTPLNAAPIPIWPHPQDKSGFGMGQFGAGDFGRDAAACVGFGKGGFGNGPFGMDADAIEWISPLLPLGIYRFGVRILDASGNESALGQTNSIAVIPPARPAATLTITAFDPQTNQLTLHISDD